jgi:hypothetical protein
MAPSERSIGSVVYPEYQWVDDLPSPANVGESRGVPFSYPLFGRRAENAVYGVNDRTEQMFLTDVSTHHIQFLMVANRDPMFGWAKHHPDLFVVYDRSGEYTVYSVREEFVR